MISVCGIDCGECIAFGKECSGCTAVEGKPYWVAEADISVCTIYNCCANDKKLTDCGKCAALPCQIYFDFKDPSISQEVRTAP